MSAINNAHRNSNKNNSHTHTEKSYEKKWTDVKRARIESNVNTGHTKRIQSNLITTEYLFSFTLCSLWLLFMSLVLFFFFIVDLCVALFFLWFILRVGKVHWNTSMDVYLGKYSYLYLHGNTRSRTHKMQYWKHTALIDFSYSLNFGNFKFNCLNVFRFMWVVISSIRVKSTNILKLNH